MMVDIRQYAWRRKKSWLCYVITECEMESCGISGWMYQCVAFGNTNEEIYQNWVENVKAIYGVDFSGCIKPYVTRNGKHIYLCDWYELGKCELKDGVYGDAAELEVVHHYTDHDTKERKVK